ncbi:MAG: ribonuclease III [Polyangiales bacterium]
MSTKPARKTHPLEDSLEYTFNSQELLLTAMTHRSYRNEHAAIDADNERLEFLGDAALGMITAELLFATRPKASEGELTRLRAELVCEAGLRSVADELDIGAALRLGKGEERSGGREKARLLCSAFEALVGALLLDAGYADAREVVRRLFDPRLQDVSAERDAKSRLQELMQRTQSVTPRYQLLETSGPDHARTFHVAVLADGKILARGSGSSKARAEQYAATSALENVSAEESEAADESAAADESE